MPITTIVQASETSENEPQRSVASRVIESFNPRLPDIPLLVFLDNVVCEALRNNIGSENRGFFIPTNARSFGDLPLPNYVAQEIRKTSCDYKVDFPFRGMVYIYSDIAAHEPALAMTLAHELQHFAQYSGNQKTWAWNKVLMRCGTLTEIEHFTSRDFPIEFEARLVAKRIHEGIFGADETKGYIAHKQESATLPRDIDDWRFIQGLDTTMSYDCTLKTRQLFQRLCANEYKNAIEQALLLTLGDPEFDELVLDDFIGTSQT